MAWTAVPDAGSCHSSILARTRCPGDENSPRVRRHQPDRRHSEWLHSFPQELQPRVGHWDLGCHLLVSENPLPWLDPKSLSASPACKPKAGSGGHSAIYWPCWFMSCRFWNPGTNRSQPCLEEGLACILLLASCKSPVWFPPLPSNFTSLRPISSPAQSFHCPDFSNPHTWPCHPGLKLLQCLLMSVTVPTLSQECEILRIPCLGDSLENRVSTSMNKVIRVN